MKLPMAVTMMCAALSFLGCGAPDEVGDSTAPVSEESRTVTQLACSGLPLCSQYAGKTCSPLYSRLPCCNNDNPDELVCSTNGVTTALTWNFW